MFFIFLFPFFLSLAFHRKKSDSIFLLDRSARRKKKFGESYRSSSELELELAEDTCKIQTQALSLSLSFFRRPHCFIFYSESMSFLWAASSELGCVDVALASKRIFKKCFFGAKVLKNAREILSSKRDRERRRERPR